MEYMLNKVFTSVGLCHEIPLIPPPNPESNRQHQDSSLVTIMDKNPFNIALYFLIKLITTNLNRITLTEFKMKTELNPVWLAK
jgi:hypothetical protein